MDECRTAFDLPFVDDDLSSFRYTVYHRIGYKMVTTINHNNVDKERNYPFQPF